jgi:hypothetical protein
MDDCHFFHIVIPMILNWGHIKKVPQKTLANVLVELDAIKKSLLSLDVESPLSNSDYGKKSFLRFPHKLLN